MVSTIMMGGLNPLYWIKLRKMILYTKKNSMNHLCNLQNKYYALFTEEPSFKKIYGFLNSKETNEFQHVTSFLPFNDVGIGENSVGN